MEPDDTEAKIKQLQLDILKKKGELEALTGKKCLYTRKGNLDMRSLRLNTDTQEEFKKNIKIRNQKLKEARLLELEQAMDKTIERTLNKVIEKKREEVKNSSRDSTPLRFK